MTGKQLKLDASAFKLGAGPGAIVGTVALYFIINSLSTGISEALVWAISALAGGVPTALLLGFSAALASGYFNKDESHQGHDIVDVEMGYVEGITRQQGLVTSENQGQDQEPPSYQQAMNQQPINAGNLQRLSATTANQSTDNPRTRRASV